MASKIVRLKAKEGVFTYNPEKDEESEFRRFSKLLPKENPIRRGVEDSSQELSLVGFNPADVASTTPYFEIRVWGQLCEQVKVYEEEAQASPPFSLD